MLVSYYTAKNMTFIQNSNAKLKSNINKSNHNYTEKKNQIKYIYIPKENINAKNK